MEAEAGIKPYSYHLYRITACTRFYVSSQSSLPYFVTGYHCARCKAAINSSLRMLDRPGMSFSRTIFISSTLDQFC